MPVITRLGPTGSAPNIINQGGITLAILSPDGLPEHQITGIAGEAIATGDLCYITSAAAVNGQPEIKRTIGTSLAAGRCRGIAVNRAASGASVTIFAGVDVLYAAASGMTPGAEMYNSDTAGAVEPTTAATNSFNIGFAVTDQILHVYNHSRSTKDASANVPLL